MRHLSTVFLRKIKFYVCILAQNFNNCKQTNLQMPSHKRLSYACFHVGVPRRLSCGRKNNYRIPTAGIHNPNRFTQAILLLRKSGSILCYNRSWKLYAWKHYKRHNNLCLLYCIISCVRCLQQPVVQKLGGSITPQGD